MQTPVPLSANVSTTSSQRLEDALPRSLLGQHPLANSTTISPFPFCVKWKWKYGCPLAEEQAEQFNQLLRDHFLAA